MSIVIRRENATLVKKNFIVNFNWHSHNIVFGWLNKKRISELTWPPPPPKQVFMKFDSSEIE